jgi:ABC-2 type transport system ATP-binding protein
MYIGMGAGVYVGRIGGLAVALGIGAAVFVGQGVASAEPSITSGAESSSTGATESTSESTETTTPFSNTKTADAVPISKRKKKSSASQQSGASQSSATTHGATLKTDTTESTKATDEPKAADDPEAVESTNATEDSTTDESSAPTISVTVSSAPEAETTKQPPTKPVESPLPGLMLAASREIGRKASVTATAKTATTSADADPTPLAAATSAADPTPLAAVEAPTPSATAEAPTPVVAIPQTAPLQGLQYLPIVGPMFVTPVVTFIHQIPLVGDMLHPLIGYPVRFGLAPGTPVPRDVKVISFDGTAIYVHLMPAAGLGKGQKAPTILDGPGLALPGATNPDALNDEFLSNDVIGVGTLRHNGYNVVTWDPRGEWNSGGTLQVDHPDFEGKDVSAIISWLATQPEVQLDGDPKLLDPRIGMVGASYGGGIQLATAANDHRIDAIVPTIAWHSLTTSLYKDQAFKSSWGTILVAALIGTNARVNPRIYPGLIYGDITGTVRPEDVDLIEERGPGDLVKQITAPTLLIQGTVDTLFTLAEADANAKALIAAGVPTKVVWFCGGHGACLSTTNDGVMVKQATMDWLNRYVKGLNVDTGPQFEWVDQHGQRFGSNTYPVKQGTPIIASSSKGGVLPLLPFIGGSGPEIRILTAGPIGALLGIPSGSRALNALNLTVPEATSTTYIVGAPQLTLTYSGTGTSRHVYAQLVDDTTGLVLGNLVTPVPVTLDGKTHTVSVPMEMVAQTLEPGETVTLQIVASAFPYETLISPGMLNVSSMTLSMPTADASALSMTPAVEMAA